MNGPHDMGGQQCHGPVVAEKNEPVFHAEWEKRALALTVAMGFTGSWNLDISRHSRESLPPADYLAFSYYQIWIAALIELMKTRGMVDDGEVTSGHMSAGPVAVKQVLKGADTPAALAAGGPVSREPVGSPYFKRGDRVQAKNMHPSGHTRLPRYARRATGTVHGVQGFHVFPDTNSEGQGECPQWLYSVEFAAIELFGESADANHSVFIDCWEPYLEAG